MRLITINADHSNKEQSLVGNKLKKLSYLSIIEFNFTYALRCK